VARWALAGLLAVMLLSGCSLLAAAPRPVEQPQSFRGSGINQTATFTLAGGDYAIDWTARPATHMGCYHGGSLDHSDGRSEDLVWNDATESAAAISGTKHLHAIPAGAYYFDMSSGCAWSMTVRPE
jgi:hypothetical protein